MYAYIFVSYWDKAVKQLLFGRKHTFSLILVVIVNFDVSLFQVSRVVDV